MNKRMHLSREHFDQHIAEVFNYMKQPVDGGSATSNRGWDVMTQTLVESLTEDHVGAFDLPDVFERAMERVWDRILHDSKTNPADMVKTYHVTVPVNNNPSSPHLYVDTNSYLSDDDWSLTTMVGLLTNIHSVGSQHTTEEDEKILPFKYSNAEPMDSFKMTPMDAHISQKGQFIAKAADSWLPHSDEKFNAFTDKPKSLEQRIAALEHDLTEVVAALVNKDIMRTH